jgi:hypothetical protein
MGLPLSTKPHSVVLRMGSTAPNPPVLLLEPFALIINNQPVVRVFYLLNRLIRYFRCVQGKTL